MALLKRIVFMAFLPAMLPASAYAQATLAGVVKDASGAVLPGVTVEASSPALIEKARSADHRWHRPVSDRRSASRHLLRDVHARRVSRSSRREGVEVSGAGVITVNADMKVGNVAETVNVSGEAPVVETQSTKRQAVIENKVINELARRARLRRDSRRRADVAGRGRQLVLVGQPQLLHGARRSRQRRHRPARRAERRRGVQRRRRVGQRLRRGQRAGNADYDLRQPRRRRNGRADSEHRAEDRRQPFQRVVLRHQRRQLGAGQQRGRRAQGAGRAGGRRPHQAVGHQRRASAGPSRATSCGSSSTTATSATTRRSPAGYANKFAGDASHWDYAPDHAVLAAPRRRKPSSRSV